MAEKQVGVSYRIAPHLLAWLKDQSRQHDRSMNWVVNKIFENAKQQQQGAKA